MKLDRYGFVEVGFCELTDGLKHGVAFKLYKLREERVVYSFVVENKVNYIGVCDTTNTTLKKRMSRYQGQVGAGTNKRIANNIKNCLKLGKNVKIFALKPEASLKYMDLNVDLIKGLENPLIEQFDHPEWNKHI